MTRFTFPEVLINMENTNQQPQDIQQATSAPIQPQSPVLVSKSSLPLLMIIFGIVELLLGFLFWSGASQLNSQNDSLGISSTATIVSIIFPLLGITALAQVVFGIIKRREQISSTHKKISLFLLVVGLILFTVSVGLEFSPIFSLYSTIR